MDFLTEKPMQLEAVLPQEICFETSEELEDPKALLKEYATDKTCPNDAIACLDLVREEGCKYYFLLGTDLANCIEAKRYVIVLMDDCEYCDCCEIEFKRKCKIVHKSTNESNKKECC